MLSWKLLGSLKRDFVILQRDTFIEAVSWTYVVVESPLFLEAQQTSGPSPAAAIANPR